MATRTIKVNQYTLTIHPEHDEGLRWVDIHDRGRFMESAEFDGEELHGGDWADGLTEEEQDGVHEVYGSLEAALRATTDDA